MQNKIMFLVNGTREMPNGPHASLPLQAAFCEDGSVCEFIDFNTKNILGSWKWTYETGSLEVFMPGMRHISLNLDKALDKYFSWLTKQVVN